MHQLILNDGTTYAADWCSGDGLVLCAQISDAEITLVELAEKFSDPNATQHIVFDYHAGEKIYDGYTHLIMVQDQRWQSGGLLVQLRRVG